MEQQPKLYNVSSSPHVRSKLTTGNVMLDVIIALLPAAIMGAIHYGFSAVLVILLSVGTAVLTEYLFCLLTKRPQTIGDFSAVVTGLLLALCLSPMVPWYVPVLGAAFAIFFVKCVFGGLGKNFVNPALAARCFLLISFGAAMTKYGFDGVSSATPLSGSANAHIGMVIDAYLGRGAGIIGSSTGALLIGAAYLWMTGGICMEVPAAFIGAFTLFMGIFGDKGFDLISLLFHLAGGGVIMGAFFMATDPVTSPMTVPGRILFGAAAGLLSGLFRVFGSSNDSVSYAIIIANMFVPFIDMYIVPKPYGLRKKALAILANGGAPVKKEGIPKSAVVLCAITLISGLALSGAYQLTKDTIAEQQAAAAAMSYREVCPAAASFRSDDAAKKAIEELAGGVYGSSFGKSYIREVWVGQDESGADCGYVICVASGDGFDGTLAFSMGLELDGTITGISFTELHESAGMGMVCGEESFRGQFVGRAVDSFRLNKAGGSTAPEEIDSVSGASVTSGAVVNAVNAGLDFFRSYLGR